MMTLNPEPEHEGWSNRATWGVALVIDNERERQTDALDIVRDDPEAAHANLRDWVGEIIDPDDFPAREPIDAMKLTLMQAGLLRVNWNELADHYRGKLKDGAT